MVRYHGRARQLVNINRKTAGSKLSGLSTRTGHSVAGARYIQRRVNSNVAVGCVDSKGIATGKRRVYDAQGTKSCVAKGKWLLVTAAPRSRGCAGGVHLLGQNIKCR